MYYWLILVAVFLIISFLLIQFGPLKGSTPQDFPKENLAAESPFEPCPNSPNCTETTVSLNESGAEGFESVIEAVKKMNPKEINITGDEFFIHAVFRISVFGFLDDVKIMLTETDSDTLLHIQSSSREGYSDLGVNRRRIKKILRYL